MTEESHTLLVAASDREAFALCLALGTLEAVRSGDWPTEAGIWTIARPVFREPLETEGIPEDVLRGIPWC